MMNEPPRLQKPGARTRFRAGLPIVRFVFPA